MLPNDFKICLSSLEISLFNDTCHKVCPCCGCHLLTEPTNEVRLSTIVILLGVGSFVCYKLFRRKNRQGKSFRLVDIISYIINGCDESESSQQNTTSYNHAHEATDISPSSLSEDAFSFDTFYAKELDDSNASRTLKKQLTKTFSQSSLFGYNTIGKLDQLLTQIEDIKNSVSEMDADLFQVGSTRKKVDQKYLTLTSNMSIDDEVVENTEEFSPSLEWDSNDVNYLELSDIKNNSDSVVPRKHSFRTTQDFSSSILSLTPSSSFVSSIHSNKDSPLSSPEQDSDKAKTLQDLLTEARRLGILNDLINALQKDSKRDSAYCED
ncbi:hypothetical protein B4U80_10619 [Leptotrombidium deliense]|uniref:Uncharacterized protein n=1 Tax=Leptotrombidium deliense TaxID=299467 RepID=A0A443SFI8_9ACAR|nr:hypothetical protein B4U80_10619 [Leptotrombidium deliense]